jgi:hypothetical protein
LAMTFFNLLGVQWTSDFKYYLLLVFHKCGSGIAHRFWRPSTYAGFNF